MIKEFQGEYRWLSNFAPVKVVYDGVSYRSVEHAYMAAKSLDEEWRKYCRDTFKAGDVKRASRNIVLRDDWEDIKLNVMESLLWQKYTQHPYKQQLLNTGDEYIQEGNMWGDKYWGVCLRTNKGQNHLGSIIMRIRENLS